MSYIDDLNDAASRAQDAADTAEGASQILFDVANGDSVSTVTTASGEVKTVAKAIADIEASFEGGLFNSTVEEVTLADGQTAVTLTNATTDSMQLYVEGAREFDFEITGTDSFELSESFPAGTRIWVVSGEAYSDLGSVPITATGSTDPRSLADRFGVVVNVLDFGASGDDSTDNYAAWQAAFDRAAELVASSYNGVVVVAPAGTYRFSQRAVCQVAPSGTPSTGTPSVALLGAGSSQTYLVANEGNTEGCVYLTSDKNDELFSVKGVGFLSDLDADAATTNGVGLHIDSTLTQGTAGFGSQPRRTVHLSDLYFGGYGTTSGERSDRGNFTKQLLVENKWWPYADDIYCRGSSFPFDATTNAPLYTVTGRTHMVHFKNCYSPEIGDIQCTGYALNGLVIEGRDDNPSNTSDSDFEDFRVHDAFLVGQDKGFSLLHGSDQENLSLYEPGGAISNLHVSSYTSNIHLRYHRQIVADNIYLYIPKGKGLPDYTGNPTALLLEGIDDLLVGNIEFLESGFYTDDDNCACSIRVIKRANASIGNVQFNCGGIGVKTPSGANGGVTIRQAKVGGAGSGLWPTFKLLKDEALITSVGVNSPNPAAGYVEDYLTSQMEGSASLRHSLRNDRQDYATVGGYQAGSYSVYGPDSSGNIELASQLRTDFSSNVDGSESSDLVLFLKSNGSTSQVAKISGATKRIAANAGFEASGQVGVTGSFTSADGKTITVTGGIITGIA